MRELHVSPGLPDPQGLYNPALERDACGLGFVAHLKGEKSHEIINNGVEILINLTHRGACGCDPETGDGAGLLTQIPHRFFEKEAAKLGFTLPAEGSYGVAMIFLPVDRYDRLRCEALVEKTIAEEGLELLGWRACDTNPDAIGRVARSTQPYIAQVFVKGPAGMDQDTLERRLYITRRVAMNRVSTSDIGESRFFYICSFSTRTIVYKGLLLAPQIREFYRDLTDPDFVSALCMVHQRFSTNTFPTWHLAHPFRYVCHNGEINTIRGNTAWMNARQSVLESPLFGDEIKKLFPIILPNGSDSQGLDNVVELLALSGRSLPHVMAMLIPEAWDADNTMDEDRKAFYEYHASLMEPWDGPAAVAFTDGRMVGATLDRNGLRPARYYVTTDDLVIMASETGVLPVEPKNTRSKGRLQPGRMFLVNMEEGRIVPDEEIKNELKSRKPYKEWIEKNQIRLEDLPDSGRSFPASHETLLQVQRAFGYTDEDIRMIMGPMAADGQEPVGSMGIDTPLACLSDKPQPLFHYFKQLFAQVTNPAIDPIREELVMSLLSYIGSERNLLDETAEHCQTLRLDHPILENKDLEKLRRVSSDGFLANTLPTLFRVADGAEGLQRAVDSLCKRASLAVKSGYSVLILSDRGLDEEYAPIPSLLALSAVHNHLTREELRTQCALIVESGEPREVMHFALLVGYGASAVNPFLAFETIDDLSRRGLLGDSPPEKLHKKYIKAVNKGLLKVFSKMGVSTLQSYRGAQLFEAIGLNKAFVDKYFTGTPSRIEGVGMEVVAREALMKHDHAFRTITDDEPELDVGGAYQFRARGEYHLYNPHTVSKLQHAVRNESFQTFKEYSNHINQQEKHRATLRGLMRFREAANPIPLEEVEPASSIVKRFATGAMSFGSISAEAHETLAIAMNRIGARSNTGEGGEDPARFLPLPNGDSKRSSIKQVASGRFGVTTHYLVNADELQIKIAQGAKPGEGGQLPGHKVDAIIARVRHSVPGVGLISPPPHHDIYSIEDLAQLIFDLKNVNPQARISVKLVSEVGVGVVAAGVAKAHADVVLISGHDGGTGASPLTSIRHAGVPWELGLAETQQVLLMNDLRSRVIVQTDGKLQTGRDVAIAALLGAEEFGFSTAPLVAMGCIMMRKCHLNTCPVGIATQDPVLRAKFAGAPEHVINFFFFIAEEVREIMAKLGIRRMDDMIGRSDLLEMEPEVNHWKASQLDLSSILYRPDVPSRVAPRCIIAQDHGLETAIDHELIRLAQPTFQNRQSVYAELELRNVHRTVGAMLSGQVAKSFNDNPLPPDTLHFKFRGSAGQSFGAFLEKGITLELEGDANDYVGKGLSGGRLVVYPPREAPFVPEENILIGNTVMYGATSGEAYYNGVAGERFCVRNSGAIAVVEGVGDHGCEYMTNGTVVVLGSAGRNFAAGMSGGIAYVLDESGDFGRFKCNMASVDLFPVELEEDQVLLKRLIQNHADYTASPKAKWILEQWDEMLPKFVKVFPHEFQRVLGVAKPAQAESKPESVQVAGTKEVVRG
jgi:glutamate synthase (NADPH/NADH) large chain